ncbi:hypothetical protein SISSUDRAFT_1047937 [Sistotremastrum suecicum HHB10207 ss-3]|uniref:RNase III domain-containing protein n=1 Tax=Sistotremastrum suecicum HHB10207 ss-3 TaxID=1314776 RepID=A0A166CV35_9AGAM|nr:hypothetical protein SISSUDRAFT_1047937 [Sistotremastrum suecicum HHB10207 ss-3]
MAPHRDPKQLHPGAFDIANRTEPYRRHLALKATKQAIYRLKTATVFPRPSVMPDELQRIIFSCHREERQRWGDDYMPPWFSPDFVPPPGTRRISNKLLELWGDAIMHYAVPRVNEEYGKSRKHHAEGSRRLQQNHVFAHFAVEINLLNNPHIHISEEDRLEIAMFDPNSDQDPPKILANLFEAFVGGLWWSGGLAAVFGWLNPILKALQSCANRRDLETSKDQTRPFGFKTFYDAECIDKLISYISSHKRQFRKLGTRLRHALPKQEAMLFDSQGVLRPGFSHTAETAEGLIRVNILSGWYLTRLEVFFTASDEIAPIVSHLSEVCDLIMTPSVLACLARVLGLDRHIQWSHIEVPMRALAYAFISSVGFFERRNDHQLFALEPLFALLANVADYVLKSTPRWNPYTHRLVLASLP